MNKLILRKLTFALKNFHGFFSQAFGTLMIYLIIIVGLINNGNCFLYKRSEKNYMPFVRQEDKNFFEISSEVDQIIEFPDRNLEFAIRVALNKLSGAITISDMEKLKSLVAVDFDIYSLEGLQYAVNLEFLNLSINKISDISQLENLTKLKELYLVSNEIRDISYIKKLTNLTVLYLDDNQIEDISALMMLDNPEEPNESKLNKLGLNLNLISDISPLKNLIDLTYLRAASQKSREKISDISVLNKLTALTWLDLHGNQISDINSLKNLSNLNYLNLSNNQISELPEFFLKFNNLKKLDLSKNLIKNIDNLSGIKNLDWLDLSYNYISDISVLESLVNLIVLNLRWNQISDIKALVKNKGLGKGDWVKLEYNYLDLSPESEDMINIKILKERGVHVLYKPQREEDY